MSNFPSVKAKDFIKVIKKLGFYPDRQKGSHAIYTVVATESLFHFIWVKILNRVH